MQYSSKLRLSFSCPISLLFSPKIKLRSVLNTLKFPVAPLFKWIDQLNDSWETADIKKVTLCLTSTFYSLRPIQDRLIWNWSISNRYIQDRSLPDRTSISYRTIPDWPCSHKFLPDWTISDSLTDWSLPDWSLSDKLISNR